MQYHRYVEDTQLYTVIDAGALNAIACSMITPCRMLLPSVTFNFYNVVRTALHGLYVRAIPLLIDQFIETAALTSGLSDNAIQDNGQHTESSAQSTTQIPRQVHHRLFTCTLFSIVENKLTCCPNSIP